MRCRIIEELLLSVSLGFFSTVYRQHIRICIPGNTSGWGKALWVRCLSKKTKQWPDQNLSLHLLIRNTAHWSTGFFCSGKINLCYLRKVLQTFDKISLHTKQSTNAISLTEWPSYIFRWMPWHWQVLQLPRPSRRLRENGYCPGEVSKELRSMWWRYL